MLDTHQSSFLNQDGDRHRLERKKNEKDENFQTHKDPLIFGS